MKQVRGTQNVVNRICIPDRLAHLTGVELCIFLEREIETSPMSATGPYEATRRNYIFYIFAIAEVVNRKFRGS